MDWTSFKSTYCCVLLLQIFLSSTIYFTPSHPWLYLCAVAASMACEGGHFALLATVAAKLACKEQRGRVSGLLYYNFGLGAMLGFALELFVVRYTGYLPMFLTFSVMSAVSFVLLLWRFEEKTPWMDADPADYASLK